MKAVLAELQGMAAKPVPSDELTGIKNYMAGNYVLSMETQAGVIAQLSNMKTLGLSNDYLETYVTRVRSVEPPQIQAAARKYITPEQSVIVVVGDAKVIGEAVKKFGAVTVTKAK
jgi:predicted Zn-dependent peptidase